MTIAFVCSASWYPRLPNKYWHGCAWGQQCNTKMCSIWHTAASYYLAQRKWRTNIIIKWCWGWFFIYFHTVLYFILYRQAYNGFCCCCWCFADVVARRELHAGCSNVVPEAVNVRERTSTAQNNSSSIIIMHFLKIHILTIALLTRLYIMYFSQLPALMGLSLRYHVLTGCTWELIFASLRMVG